MWTLEHRRAADRRGLRYPSDLSDAEWAHDSVVRQQVMCRPKGKLRAIVHGFFHGLRPL